MSTSIGGTFISTIYQLADGVVTTEKLADKAVTTEKIDDEAVTGDQLLLIENVDGERIGGERDWDFKIATATYWTLTHSGTNSAASMTAGDPGSFTLSCRGTTGEFSQIASTTLHQLALQGPLNEFFVNLISHSNVTADHAVKIGFIREGVIKSYSIMNVSENGPLIFTEYPTVDEIDGPFNIFIRIEGTGSSAEVASITMTQLRIGVGVSTIRSGPIVVY